MASLAIHSGAGAAFVGTARKPSRPALRYPGDKFAVAPWIIEHMGEHQTYVEPFGGAMSVLLQKEPAHAELYNDLDAGVVEFFRVLRDPVSAAQLRSQLSLTPFHPAELELSLEWHSDPIERARRLVVRSFMSQGCTAFTAAPVFRSAMPRQAQPPAKDWAQLPGHLDVVTERLRHVTFANRPALQILKRHDHADAMFFVDPPAIAGPRSVKRPSAAFLDGYRPDMSRAEHVKLLDQLVAMKGKVVLSAPRSPLYERKLKGWVRFDRKADQAEQSDSLWLNPHADRVRPNPSLFGSLQ